jgi:hypothetical protein
MHVDKALDHQLSGPVKAIIVCEKLQLCTPSMQFIAGLVVFPAAVLQWWDLMRSLPIYQDVVVIIGVQLP